MVLNYRILVVYKVAVINLTSSIEVQNSLYPFYLLSWYAKHIHFWCVFSPCFYNCFVLRFFILALLLLLYLVYYLKGLAHSTHHSQRLGLRERWLIRACHQP